MTTVALRGRTLATDSLSTVGSSRVDLAPKLFRVRPGLIAAVCGSRALGLRFREWLKDGAPGDSPYHRDSDGTGIVLTAVGAYHFCRNGPLPIHAAFYAIGSGANYALGAMHAGASAEAAVASGIEFDVNSGGPIQIMTLET